MKLFIQASYQIEASKQQLHLMNKREQKKCKIKEKVSQRKSYSKGK